MKRQNQHYVSQFFLKEFETQNQIHVLDKTNNKIFLTSPRNMCSEFDFFALDENFDLCNKNFIEEELSKIESNIEPIVTNIRNQNSLESIKNDDFLSLIEWIAWIFIANPAYKANLHSMIEAVQSKTPQTISLNNTNILTILINTHAKIVNHFRNRFWILCVIEPENGSLVTSDRPVNLLGTTVDEIVGLDAGILYCPISPQLLLLSKKIGPCGFRLKPFNKYSVAQLKISNNLSFTKSNRFIIANNSKILNEIKGNYPNPIAKNFGHPQIEYWDENEKHRIIKITNR